MFFHPDHGWCYTADEMREIARRQAAALPDPGRTYSSGGHIPDPMPVETIVGLYAGLPEPRRHRVRVGSYRATGGRRWYYTCPGGDRPHSVSYLTHAEAIAAAHRHAEGCGR